MRTGLGEVVLEDLLGQPELPDLEPEVSPVPKRAKTVARNEFVWEKERRNFTSKAPTIFPEHYSKFKGLSPKGL